MSNTNQPSRFQKITKDPDDSIRMGGILSTLGGSNSFLRSSDPMQRFIGKILSNAERQGTLAENLAEDLGEREVLISQLLGYMNEDLLARYFDEFLFKKKIPWQKTREFIQKAVDGEAKGCKATDVLDFSLRFYDERRNFGNTLQIIDDAFELQPTMRTTPVFPAMKDALGGSTKETSSFILLGKQNIDKAILLNRLIGMVSARGSEDLEKLRQEYVKGLDELKQKKEVDDRFKGIYDAMLSTEFNRAMTRNVQFVTDQFALSTRDPIVQSFVRILYDLKLGQEFNKQIFSGVESRPTAKESPGLGQQRSFGLTGRRSDTFVKRTVFAQTENENLTEDQKNNFLSEVNLIINSIDKAKKDLKEKGSRFPALVNQFETYLNQAKNEFNTLIYRINTNQPKEALIKKYYDCWSMFSNVKFTTANILNQNIRLAQVGALGPSQPLLNTDANTGFFGGTGTIVKADLQQNLAIAGGALAGLTAAGALLEGNLKGAVAAYAAAMLTARNFEVLAKAKQLGVDPPKDMTSDAVRSNAAIQFNRLTNNPLEQQAFATLEEFRTNANAAIASKERALTLKIEAEVKTQEGNKTTPLAMPETIAAEYKDFMSYLNEALRSFSYELDLIRQVVARNQAENPNILQQLGSIQQFISDLDADVQNTRNKIAEYYSFSLIVENIQKKRLILLKLSEIVPDINKYLAVGISVADLLASPGGLMGRIRDIIDLEKDNKQKLFSAWQAIIQQFPQYKYIDEKYAPVTKTQSTVAPHTPLFTNAIFEPRNSSPSPSTTESQSVVTDYAGNVLGEGGHFIPKTSSVTRFDNLIFEKSRTVVAQDKYEDLYDNPATSVSGIANTTFSTEDQIPRTETKPIVPPKELVTEDEKNQAIYNKINQILGMYSVSPGPSANTTRPEQIIASLRKQIAVVTKSISELEALEMELLQNPQSLGSINQMIAHSNAKFVKLANEFQPKFKKVGDEDTDTESADQRFEDYWNYMGTRSQSPVPEGDIRSERPEHSGLTNEQEIEKHKDTMNKWNKIDKI